MLASLKNWFEQLSTEPEQQQHSIELAMAVMYLEIVRADSAMDESEMATFRALLQNQFELSADELANLHILANEQVSEAADFQQFTRVLNDKLGLEDKRYMMECLWRLAYADGHLDGNEEHLIRKIADLLYVSHSDFIRAKLKVTETNPPSVSE